MLESGPSIKRGAAFRCSTLVAMVLRRAVAPLAVPAAAPGPPARPPSLAVLLLGLLLAACGPCGPTGATARLLPPR